MYVHCANTFHNHSHPGLIEMTYDRLLFAFHCGRYCLCCSSDEEEKVMSKPAAPPLICQFSLILVRGGVWGRENCNSKDFR